MAIPFFIDKRHLIPNWRSFKSTLNHGELGANTDFFKSIHIDDIFEKRKEAWREHQALLTATELLGAAIMFDINDCPEVREAATYIEYNALSSSSSMLSVAGRFHHPENIGKSPAIKVLDSFEEFDEMQLKSKIYAKIRRVKNDLINFPGNAIQWVELARYYSTIGVIEKAKMAMKIALSLSVR